MANLLQTRSDECKIIHIVDNEKNQSKSGLLHVDVIEKQSYVSHLEPMIVEYVANHHNEYIQRNGIAINLLDGNVICSTVVNYFLMVDLFRDGSPNKREIEEEVLCINPIEFKSKQIHK